MILLKISHYWNNDILLGIIIFAAIGGMVYKELKKRENKSNSEETDD